MRMKEPSLLFQKKFSGFFWTQFLGAFNDNAFKNGIIFTVTYQLTQVLPKAEADFYVTLGAGLFILPYVLFSTWAATWADQWGKSRVIISTKVLEIVIMSLGGIGFYLLDFADPKPAINLLMGVLFLMGTQSALFSPSKYGILPEILKERELVEGNGLLEMGTFVSILLGTYTGGLLVQALGDRPFIMSIAFIFIAIFGMLTSLTVPKTAPVSPDARIRWFFLNQVVDDYRLMLTKDILPPLIVGISYFWFMGAVFLTILPGFGKTVGASLSQTNTMMIVFSVGIGIGSMLCAKLSHGKIEMGMVPFGALGVMVLCFDFGFFYPEQVDGWGDLWRVYFDLIGIGLFGGFFIVPLNTLLQQRTTDSERARMIAFNNIINAIFMVFASGFVLLTRTVMELNEAEIFQIVGFLLIVCTVTICMLLWDFFTRFVQWIFVSLVFKVDLTQIHIKNHDPLVMQTENLEVFDLFAINMLSHRTIHTILPHEAPNSKALKWFFNKLHVHFLDKHNYETLLEMAIKAREKDDVLCFANLGILLPSEKSRMKDFVSQLQKMKAFESVRLKVVKPVELGLNLEGGKIKRTGRLNLFCRLEIRMD